MVRVLICAIALAGCTGALANPHIEGIITSTGMGTVDPAAARNPVQARLMAKRAAVTEAQRNLLESVEGVRVTSGTTVKDAQLESDLVANRVKGLLRGAFTIDESLTELDGTWLAEVTLGICVNRGDTRCANRPTLGEAMQESLPTGSTPYEAPAPAQADTPAATAPVWTGLVVDLRGSNYDPTLDTRLVTADGKEIYGPSRFDPTRGVDWFHWATDIDAARADASVIGKQPLVVTPSSSTTAGGIVLSDADAATIHAASRANGRFLAAGAVILVVTERDT